MTQGLTHHTGILLVLAVSLAFPPFPARAQSASQTPYTGDTQGVACGPNGALAYNGNSFVLCSSGAWAVQPVTIGTASSAPYTCSSTYEGMLYFDTGASAVKLCNGSSWTAVGGGTPSGSNTQVQYNSSGSFGADSSFTYVTPGALTLGVAGSHLGILTLSGNTSGTTILQPTAAASGTLTFPAVTDTIAVLGTAQTWTAANNWNIASAIASSSSAKLDDVKVQAATTTVTGTTEIATSGFGKVSLYQPTITDASVLTIDNAATLYIDNSPLAAGLVTITNPWAIEINAGNVKFPGTGNVLGTINSGTWNGSPIGVGYGGTGTPTTFTQGSIVFAGASGIYNQDNAQFFWDDTNHKLGIGVATPSKDLSFGGAAARQMWMERAASGAGNNLTISAGGAISGGTDLSGGNLVLSSGISTGTRTSNVQLAVYPAATSTGSSDNTQTTAVTVSAANSGIASQAAFTTIAATRAAVGATDTAGGNLHIDSGTSTGSGYQGNEIVMGAYQGFGSNGTTDSSPTNTFVVGPAGAAAIDSSYTYCCGTTADNILSSTNYAALSAYNNAQVTTDVVFGSAAIWAENDYNSAIDGAQIILFHGRGNGVTAATAGDTAGQIDYQMWDSTAAAKVSFGQIRGMVISPTNGSATGKLVFAAATASAPFDEMTLTSSGIYLGGNVSPTNILSLSGQAARTIWMERETTGNTAGNNLTVRAGGATSAATNKSGGTLILSGGTSTGSGTGQIQFSVFPGTAGSTSDNTVFTAGTVSENSSTGGVVTLNGVTSGTVAIQTAAVAGTGTVFQLPSSNGTNGYFLQTDGNGVTSWVTGGGSGSGVVGGSNTQVQFDNAGNFGGSPNLTWVSPTLTVGAAGSATGQLALAGSASGTTTLQPNNAASGTLTLPAATDTLVGRATTDTLTNKTLTDVINTDTVVSASTNATTTTLGAVTGLAVALTAGKTYAIHAYLPITASAAQGCKLSLDTSDTLTATSISYDTKIWNSTTIRVNSVSGALATSVSSTTAAVTDATIDGVIVVNAAGTLVVKFAENAASGTATANANGYLQVIRMN
jgi:hypothetical protein